MRSMLRIRNAFGSTVLPVLLRRVEETSESARARRGDPPKRLPPTAPLNFKFLRISFVTDFVT